MKNKNMKQLDDVLVQDAIGNAVNAACYALEDVFPMANQGGAGDRLSGELHKLIEAWLKKERLVYRQHAELV